MINLYDDQVEFVEQIRGELRKGIRSVLAVASTGAGKTVVSAYMAREAAAFTEWMQQRFAACGGDIKPQKGRHG